MVDRYEDTPEGQAMPYPAAMVRGRKILRIYMVEGAPEVFHWRLASAIQAAENLPPIQPGPTEAA